MLVLQLKYTKYLRILFIEFIIAINLIIAKKMINIILFSFGSIRPHEIPNRPTHQHFLDRYVLKTTLGLP